MTSPEMGSWGRTDFKSAAISQHGTYVRYAKGKCRCEPCTAANKEYSRQLIERRKADRDFRLAAMDPAKHGTTSGYRVGCRCEPCKAAVSAYEHELYQRNKAERRT